MGKAYALAALGAVCLLAGMLCLLHARRVLRALGRMLEAAIRGEAGRVAYNESALSRLEARFARYLSAGALARGKIEEERARIKELIGDISHQTKTPLANISLYTELLAEQPLPDEARAMTAQIAAQSDKLSFLIASLVKLSRLENGVVRTHPEPAPLDALLDAAREEFAPRAAEKGVRFTVRPCGLSAAFDLKWTREALGNLVDNAIKYTQPGGRVCVSARAFELFCRVDVADDGPGIPEDEHAAVFGRFQRGAAARQAEGVGIGLYLAREIAAQQGGYIRLSSEAGAGAVFSLYLPRA